MTPPAEVLAAFGIAPDTPLTLLDGGHGLAWRAHDVVFKTVQCPAEYVWICDVYDGWTAPDVVVPQPLKASSGGWVHEGWAAHCWVEGTPQEVADDPDWFLAATRAFRDAVAALPAATLEAVAPALRERTCAWATGDRVAWEGAEPEGSPTLTALVRRIRDSYEELDLPTVLAHGDPTTNFLRTPDGRPLLIEWPVFERPAAYTLAVATIDAICWQGAGMDLIDRWDDEPGWRPLLLRALAYRLAVRGAQDPTDEDVDVEEVLGAVLLGADDVAQETSR